jgi:hypothetical protein
VGRVAAGEVSGDETTAGRARFEGRHGRRAPGGLGRGGPDPGPHGFGGGFIVLCEPGGAERLWAAHEAWIQEVAQAWGWTPTIVGPDGQRRFWAEHLACGFDEPDGDDDDEDDE